MSKSKTPNSLLYIVLPALIAGIFAIVASYVEKEPTELDFKEAETQEQISIVQDRLTELSNHKPGLKISSISSTNTEQIRSDSTLSDLFLQSNPGLMRFIEQGLLNIRANEGRSLGYMVAGGGAGKTTFFKETWRYSSKQNNGKTRFYYLNDSILLRTEDLKQWFSDFGDEPDLVSLDGRYVINTLPGTKTSVDTIFSMLRDTIAQNFRNQIFVLDGLDEISSSAAKKLLRKVDEFIEGDPNDYPITLIVVGRPEGFKEHFRARRPLNGVDFQLIKFTPPRYATEEMVEIRYQNLVEYRRNSTGEESPDITHVYDVLKRHPFLVDDFSMLMLSNPIITHSKSWKSEEEYNIMEMLYGVIIARNSETHSRPPRGDHLYRVALENSILFKLNPLTDKGVFYVDPNESVQYGERKVNVRTLLNRSGLIAFDPADKDQFRFSPSWIPIFLLERRLRELKK